MPASTTSRCYQLKSQPVKPIEALLKFLAEASELEIEMFWKAYAAMGKKMDEHIIEAFKRGQSAADYDEGRKE